MARSNFPRGGDSLHYRLNLPKSRWHTSKLNGANMNVINSILIVCFALLIGHLIFPPLFHQSIYWEAILPLSIIVIVCIVVQHPRIKQFKSPLFSAEFYKEYTKGKTPPTKIEKEARKIVENATTPTTKFIELSIEIEKRIRLIAANLGLMGIRYKPMSELLSVLISKKIIGSNSAMLVQTFWRARNEAIHGVRELSEHEFVKLMKMGKILLSELDRGYRRLKK